jgi:hypothetical protein
MDLPKYFSCTHLKVISDDKYTTEQGNHNLLWHHNLKLHKDMFENLGQKNKNTIHFLRVLGC